MVPLNRVSSSPVTRRMIDRCMASEEGQTHLEKSLHRSDLAFVQEEQNYVIFRLDHNVIVTDEHFFTPDDRAN